MHTSFSITVFQYNYFILIIRELFVIINSRKTLETKLIQFLTF